MEKSILHFHFDYLNPSLSSLLIRCGMRVSDEFNLWKMATYEEETIWKYITVQGWGKEIFKVEVIQKKFKVSWQLSFGQKRKTCAPFSYFVQMNSLFEEKTKLFPLPFMSPRNTLLYLSDSERSFLCIFFSKESPFQCLQDAQNARVANWWRQCI